jgi:hypothetical protein
MLFNEKIPLFMAIKHKQFISNSDSIYDSFEKNFCSKVINQIYEIYFLEKSKFDQLMDYFITATKIDFLVFYSFVELIGKFLNSPELDDSEKW